MAAAGPDGAGSALARCVRCDRDDFAARYWGRAALLSRASELGGSFEDLFDRTAVDELVSRRGLRTPFVRMAKDGAVLPAAGYTRSGGAGAGVGDQVADDRVLANLDDGATLVLQGLHRTWPALTDFAARLSGELGHPVGVNAYITPPGRRGFAAHYDVHDVFVLHIDGAKQWRVHAPAFADPLPEQPWQQHRDAVAEQAAQPPLIDTVLHPGDALYLPRGTVHAATAGERTSIHLTVGIHPVTRYQLVEHLLEAARDVAELRAALPVGLDLADPDVLAGHLAATVELVRGFLDAASVQDAAHRLAAVLTSQTRPQPIEPLAQLAAAERVEANTALRLRSGLRVEARRTQAGCELQFLDRTLDLGSVGDAAVKIVLGGGIFAPHDLDADRHVQLALAAQLLRAGVVVPA